MHVIDALLKSRRLEKLEKEADRLLNKTGNDSAAGSPIVAERAPSSNRRCQHLIFLHSVCAIDRRGGGYLVFQQASNKKHGPCQQPCGPRKRTDNPKTSPGILAAPRHAPRSFMWQLSLKRHNYNFKHKRHIIEENMTWVCDNLPYPSV